MTSDAETRRFLKWTAVSVTFIAAVIAAGLVALIVSLILVHTGGGGDIEQITVVTVTTTP